MADWQQNTPQTGPNAERRAGPTEQELAAHSIEVSVGAGAVRVRVDGRGRLRELTIGPAAFAERDHELLADLIQGAVAEAQRRAAEDYQDDR